jgi:uncharacterized protein
MSFHRTIGQRRPFTGIELREPQFDAVLSTRPDVGFIEVPAEGCLDESPALWRLEMLRRDYPVSLHGIGLAGGRKHLERLAALIDRLEPLLVSDHLPLEDESPLTPAPLDLVASRVGLVQDRLRRPIAIETPAHDPLSPGSTMGTGEFLAEIVRRTGCGIVCDIINLQASCRLSGQDPIRALAALPADRIREIHVGVGVASDDAAFWELYTAAVRSAGPVATLIEANATLSNLAGLVAAAHAADYRLERALITARRRVAA